MNFLVLGAGSIGKRHIKNLIKLDIGKVIASDIDKAALQEVEDQYNIETFRDYKTALKQNIDVVFVCTPTSLHVPHALIALKNNHHVFIEKPLSHNLKGVDELDKLARQKNKIVMVGFMLRFNKLLLKVKELLAKQIIGKILNVRVQCGFNLAYWPKKDYSKSYSAQKSLGGGIILDAIHEFDYLQWLFGEVKKLVCFASRLSNLKINTEDNAEIIFKLKSGTFAELHLDYIQETYRRNCEIIGDKGMILFDLINKTIEVYRRGAKKWQKISFNFDVNDMYLEEIKYFINCINQKQKPLIGIKKAKQILRIALAAKKSAQENKIIKFA